MGRQELIRDRDRFPLLLVGVGYEPAEVVRARARDLREEVADEPARAGFDRRDRHGVLARDRPEADGKAGQVGQRVVHVARAALTLTARPRRGTRAWERRSREGPRSAPPIPSEGTG